MAYLVGIAVRVADWLRARSHTAVSLLAAVPQTGTPTTNEPVGRRLPNLRQVLVGVTRLPVVLLVRLRNTTEAAETAAPKQDEEHNINRPLAPGASDFDIR